MKINKKVVIIIAVFVVVAIGIFIIYKWANSSTKEVAITPNLESSQKTNPPISVDNQWFKTEIPAGFKQDKYVENPVVGTFLQSLYSGSEYTKGQIAISIRSLPSDGLAGVPDYANRLKATEQYKQVAFGGWPVDALTFVKSEGYETTVFWVNKDIYAIISASGGMQTKTDTNTALASVLDQWRWY